MWLLDDGCDTGQMKLMANAVKEMRSSWNVFNDWKGVRKITIYGPPRTPEDHADYDAARDFSRRMADHGWMSITGAGDGIMKAGHEGPTRESSFGLRIRLPFETTANEVIEGDPCSTAPSGTSSPGASCSCCMPMPSPSAPEDSERRTSCSRR